MAEATTRESILGAGAGGPLTAPTPWVPYPGFIKYEAGGVVIGNPSGLGKGPGALNLQQLYINGVIVNLSQYVLLAGGTMTGVLTLVGDPVNTFDAATKRYVDNRFTAVSGTLANYLPLTGGTLTGALTLSAGALTLSGAPTADLHAATKKYVDDQFTGLIGIPDAPSDGVNYGRKSGAWADTSLTDMGTY